MSRIIEDLQKMNGKDKDGYPTYSSATVIPNGIKILNGDLNQRATYVPNLPVKLV